MPPKEQPLKRQPLVGRVPADRTQKREVYTVLEQLYRPRCKLTTLNAVVAELVDAGGLESLGQCFGRRARTGSNPVYSTSKLRADYCMFLHVCNLAIFTGNLTMLVQWQKCTGNQWCTLSRVNLSNVSTVGVYVIWKPGNPGSVIRVGQGNIAERLIDHRNSQEINRYGNDLLVTWAAVGWASLDGVERYLAEQYSPKVGERFPNVQAIPVNLP